MLDECNPYLNGSPPQLLRSVVAFVDILGYLAATREAEQSKTSQEFLERVHSAFRKSLGQLTLEDENGIRHLPRTQGEKNRFKIRTFTDNIVIGYPIPNQLQSDGESELGEIFSNLAAFQLEMTNSGFFIRGAIAVGELYMDETMIFGGALIEAYEGEREQARDPRIVLTKSAQAAVKEHMRYYGSGAHSPHNRDLYKDADGMIFLNYLDTIMIAEDENGPFYEELTKHKHIVEQNLEAHKGKPTIWSKYAWTANYHNFFCDQYTYFSDSDRIGVEQYRMAPQRIVKG